MLRLLILFASLVLVPGPPPTGRSLRSRVPPGRENRYTQSAIMSQHKVNKVSRTYDGITETVEFGSPVALHDRRTAAAASSGTTSNGSGPSGAGVTDDVSTTGAAGGVIRQLGALMNPLGRPRRHPLEGILHLKPHARLQVIENGRDIHNSRRLVPSMKDAVSNTMSLLGTLSIPSGSLTQPEEAQILSRIGFANPADPHNLLRGLASHHFILSADDASNVSLQMATACAGACSVVRLYDIAHAGMQLPRDQRPPFSIYEFFEGNLSAYRRIFDHEESLNIQEATAD